MGLRPAGRRAAPQHPEPLVARHGAPPPRRGRAGSGHSHAPPGLAGQRPRRAVQRPDGGLPGLQAPLPGRPPGQPDVGALLPGQEGQQVRGAGRRAVQALRRPADALPRVWQGRADRAPAVQPDAEDLPGPGGGRGGRDLPPAGDGPGHVRQLRQRAAGHAAQAPVRHRPDRPELPERDHAGELHLPHPRVRADGAGVLREPARHRGRPAGRRALARRLDPGALRLVPALRHPGRQHPAPRARQGRAGPLRQAVRGRRVPLRHRLERAGGDRQPHRLRPPPPRRGEREVAHATSTTSGRPTSSRSSSSRRPGWTGASWPS